MMWSALEHRSKLSALIRRDGIPICGALAYQVSAWRRRDTISQRGRRGNWEKFDRVMARVMDVPPLPGDEK